MRHPDWPQRLDEYLRATVMTPFAWGRHDCCTFAADCALVLTGGDPMASLRGTYASMHGAYRAIADAGGMPALVTRCLGAGLFRPAQAQRGDVVLVDHAAYGFMMAVCLGAKWVGPGEHGHEFGRMDTARYAWRIG